MIRAATRPWLALAVSLVGCSPGATAGSTVRPDAPTASSVMADTTPCRDPGGYAEPLIVDWSSGSRLDLEAAMNDGVAVVAYDCDTLRLLNGCRLRASYAFVGVTVKEETIQLSNADEVQANLPLSGVSIAAGMDAESSLDLALVMVGKRSTTLSEADPSMLEGSCEGATHFVRAATVGAFAMARGSRGEVRAAAELFGAGVGAKSEEEQSKRTVDGDREACREGSPRADEPPRGCRGSLRLELVPLAKKARAKASDDSEVAAESCPEGMVRIGGKCTVATPAERKCDQGNRAACETLCERGSPRGCFLLGRSYAWSSLSRDPAEERRAKLDAGETYLGRACSMGYEDGCYEQAWIHYNDHAYPERHDPARAIAIARASCDRGGGRSCGLVATAHDPKGRDLKGDLEPDQATYTRFMQRACDLGRAAACVDLAHRLMENPATVERGFELLRRACEGGDGGACRRWYEAAEEAGREAEAVEGYALSCLAGRGFACGKAASALSRGEDRDPARGAALGRRGCYELRSPHACAALHRWPDPAELEPGERGKAARHGCVYDFQGLQPALCKDGAYHALKRRRMLDLKGCDEGDALACERLGRRQAIRACSLGNVGSCKRVRSLDHDAYRRLLTDLCRRNPDDETWCTMMRNEGWPPPKAPRRR